MIELPDRKDIGLENVKVNPPPEIIYGVNINQKESENKCKDWPEIDKKSDKYYIISNPSFFLKGFCVYYSQTKPDKKSGDNIIGIASYDDLDFSDGSSWIKIVLD